MAKAPKIIALGEVLVEVMRPGPDQPLERPGRFLGPFASGAPAIFAVAAARFGLDTGFIGAVGPDAFARLLRQRLQQEKVDASQLKTIPDRATAVAFVGYSGDGSREFVFHLRDAAAGALTPGDVVPAYFDRVEWLHLSGSTLTLNEGTRDTAQRALELALARGGLLSFDPNVRPELLPAAQARAVFEAYVRAAALLLPTRAEAQLLTGIEDPVAAGQALLAHGARLVAIKQGAEGGIFCTPEEVIQCHGYPVEEVDPTGAGDCFNAACIMGLQQGWPLARIARFATAAGALAVTRQGPMEGAPLMTEIMAVL